MFESVITALTFLVGAAATPRADNVPPPSRHADCTMRHSAVFLGSLDQLPPVVQAAIPPEVRTMAGAGQDFDSGDVGPHTLPTRRFMRAGRSGSLWFLWYEHGGLGLHEHALGFEIGVSGIGREQAPIAMLVHNFTGDPCRATDAMLDRVAAAMPGEW